MSNVAHHILRMCLATTMDGTELALAKHFAAIRFNLKDVLF
jgi:hypothetical protein